MTSIERRKTPRKSIEKLAYLNLGPQNTGGVITDVSEAGLRFHTVSPVQHAQPVHLSLLLGAGNQIEAAGELAWLDPTRTIGGIRFTVLLPGALEQIRRWMAESAPESLNRGFPPSDSRVVNEQWSKDREPTPGPASATPATAEEKGPFKQPWPNVAGTPSPGTWPEARFPLIGIEPEAQVRGQRSAFWRGLLGGVLVSAMIAASVFFIYERKAVNPTVQIGSEARNTPESLPAPAPPAVTPGFYTSTTVAEPSQPPAESPTQSSDQPRQSSEQASPPAGRESADSLTKTGPSPDTALPRKDNRPPAVPGAASKPAARNSNRKPVPERTQPAYGGEDELALAREYLHGSGRSHDSAVASRLLWVAVEKGNPAAEVVLADLYSRGDGVAKSCEQARVLLIAASGKGDSEAMQKLRELNTTGCP
jgi:hypothetical protein